MRTYNVKPYWQNYIDGKFVDGGAEPITVLNPATGEKLAAQACANIADVNAAVSAARKCHESGALSDLRPVLRGRMVRKIGDYLLDHIEEIAPILTLESGKPLWEARIEIEGAARYFEYYGNQAETMEGRSIPLGKDYFDFTHYEPRGVSAQIIPWNYPLEMTARGIAAALTTANAVVVKTPELDPLTNTFFAKAAEAAGFPDGAVRARPFAPIPELTRSSLPALSRQVSPSPLRRPKMSCPVYLNWAGNPLRLCMQTPI